MLTRPQFDRACKLLVQQYENFAPSRSKNAMRGWSWNEHSSVSGLGYLSRTSNYLSRDIRLSMDIDEAAATCIDSDTLTSQQYVVYSATFQVPCFYFAMYHSNGVPLSINELISSTLFRSGIFQDANVTTFALTRRDTPFPLISQGDHPTTGRPCWFLHPCETTVAVEELLKEVENDIDEEDMRLLMWLELWFTVLGGVHMTVPSIGGKKLRHLLGTGSLPEQNINTHKHSCFRTLATEAVIVAASRTPTGSINGALKSFTAPQLGSLALKHAFASKNIDPTIVEEIYFGNVVQAGVGQSPARQVALSAGMSSRSDATTINKVCASGMKSIMLASQSIQLGQASVVAAGGMESMSNAPFLLPRQNPVFGKFTATDSLEYDGLWDTYNNQAMGCCGESAAEKHSISREAQDAHAIDSYKRAEQAWKNGAFDAEIVPITVKGKKGDTIVREDEEYKRIIYEKVPSLRSAFKQGGSITAANSSPLNDGASALILMSAEKAKELGLTPLAKVISYADAGMDPIDFPIAPTIALPKALERANLTVDDISLFEINEAFSVVIRIAEKVLKIDPAKININGGAVALGHAIGSSGSRIVVSLVHALKSGQYGAAGVCNGGGAASAIIIQKL
ncbi:acetyl-CoA acetyltransferase [Lentinula aff. lateritia]|uniref:Acetyl-CoA acetyltransferase n=1 Tax=Lentinula aff. lateritia TaxID=2804960 RepID=A0ACC1U4D2_9AGAR|nr:acetyl-CoA acetyltransferase [Lentinula aff. lateritia]